MADKFPEDEDQMEGETVELEDENEADVEDTEDGGAIVRLKDEEDYNRNLEHFANIVEEIEPGTMAGIVSDLIEKIAKDKDARSKRDEQYEEGLRRTGLGNDAPGGAQFTGATKLVHPMLIEACVDFSARVMKELFPPGGPAKTKIIGEPERDKVEKAERKAGFMNWQSTEQMPEFRGELEQLMTQLPLGGGQYLKFMWNPQWKRPTTEFVPIDDIYLPFAATNFYTAERKTHVQYITAMEYARRVKNGMYVDVDLPMPEDPEYSKSGVANDKIEGRQDTSYNEDGLRTVFEVNTYLDVEDVGLAPYILSIDKSTNRALSLYRNWDKDDEALKELDWIVEFAFIPWRGAYPIGLTHMIGNLAGGATGALRALLDSAHIQNMPTMLKLKGGPNGQTINLQPTEVAEIEGGVGIDDVRKIAMPVPFNPPSPVLYQLLGFLVDAGKGVVQTSFEKLSDQNPNQPVGTTMALIEQGMVVFSSIHTRMHSAMTRALKILHRINSAYLTEEDIKRQAGDIEARPSDFDGPMDVVPVSDPHIFSETQRFAQIQAIMQRAQAMPQMYDLRKVEEMFLHQMKVDDDILQPKPGQDDMDPVSENVAAAMGRPIYVLPKQEHVAHLQIHMAFMQSQLFGQNPVIARSYMMPIVTHLRDHLLNYYLVEAHKAIKQGQDQNVIPKDDVNAEVALINQVQQVIEQQLKQLGQMLPQIDQIAQQVTPKPQPAPGAPADPMAVAQLNAQVQQQALQQRAQADQQRLQLEQQKLQQAAQRDQQKMQSDAQKDAQKQQLDAQQAQQDAMDKAAAREASMQEEMLRQQSEDRRSAEERASREFMNTSDNETALTLAEMEIASGEKIGLSTGTGINPGAR